MDMTHKVDIIGDNIPQPFLSDINFEAQEQVYESETVDNYDCADPINLKSQSKDVEFTSSREEASFDADEAECVSPPSSASASILSMPDPLSFSNTTSVQYDTIHSSDYASIVEYRNGVSYPSGAALKISAALDPQSEVERRLENQRHHASAPQLQSEFVNGDHSDHEFGSESEPESESSFPSVTSSFFFSSPASVASHGPGEDSHEESNEDGEPRGPRATQELVIPFLTLPEPLAVPSTIRDYSLETPHPQKRNISSPRTHSVTSAALDSVRLLIVAPSDSIRPSKEEGPSFPSLSERVKKDLDDVALQASALYHQEGSHGFELHVALPDQDLDAVLAMVIDSFAKNELFSAVVLVSEISNNAVSPIKHEIAQFSEALSPLVPVIYLLHINTNDLAEESRSQSTALRLSSSLQNSPLIPPAALSVSSVRDLHRLLSQKSDVSKRLRTEAAEKFMKWTARRQKVEIQTRLDDAPISIAYRRARLRRGYEESPTTSGHTQNDTSVSASRKGENSEGSWRQFKAQWEASWEDAYSLQRQEYFSHEVGSQPDSEEELLRTARIRSADPSSTVRSNTTKARKQSRLKRSPVARPYSSSSSSPLPATSPSLPPSSALPSTMPSSLSLSESLFLSSDEIPDTPPLPPIPLFEAFPFPSSTISLIHPSSRHSSRARSRGTASRSVSPYYASEKHISHAMPFVLDLHSGRFDPLHLPSFLALSLSILDPLRAHLWSATRRIITVPFRAANSLSTLGWSGDSMHRNQPVNDKLVSSNDSVETLDDENGNIDNPSSFSSYSYSYQFRRRLWPTGVMLVGGFLLGFAVGYLRGL